MCRETCHCYAVRLCPGSNLSIRFDSFSILLIESALEDPRLN